MEATFDAVARKPMDAAPYIGKYELYISRRSDCRIVEPRRGANCAKLVYTDAIRTQSDQKRWRSVDVNVLDLWTLHRKTPYGGTEACPYLDVVEYVVVRAVQFIGAGS